MLVKGASNFRAARLLSHFDQNSSSLGRAVHFMRKRNASAARAFACLEPHMKSQAVHRSHRGLLSFDVAESAGQRDRRFEPAQIVGGAAVEARCCLPGEMEDVRRPHVSDETLRLLRVAQIGGVPADRPGAPALAAAADRVDLAIGAFEQFEAMAAEKAGGAGDQDTGHGRKSG